MSGFCRSKHEHTTSKVIFEAGTRSFRRSSSSVLGRRKFTRVKRVGEARCKETERLQSPAEAKACFVVIQCAELSSLCPQLGLRRIQNHFLLLRKGAQAFDLQACIVIDLIQFTATSKANSPNTRVPVVLAHKTFNLRPQSTCLDSPAYSHASEKQVQQLLALQSDLMKMNNFFMGKGKKSSRRYDPCTQVMLQPSVRLEAHAVVPATPIIALSGLG